MLKLYKKLVMLLIVVGPFWWLVFTEDGQRRADTMMISLFGKATIDFNLQALDSGFSEAELKQVFPDISWQCENTSSPLGDALCHSKIGAFNGIPAKYLTIFFTSSHVSALKLNYTAYYHGELYEQLKSQMGRPQQSKDATSEATLQWHTEGGTIIVKQQLLKGEEPALLWLARG